MIFYVVLELLLLALALFLNSRNSRVGLSEGIIDFNEDENVFSENAWYCVISILILSLFMGLRGDFAEDYDNYVYIYDCLKISNFKDLVFNQSYPELGFRLLCYFVARIFDNPVFFMIVCAFIVNALILSEGRRESNDLFLYIMFFVNVGTYFISFNIMRQIMAVAIAYYGTKYLHDDKIFKYEVCILLAALFHVSALIMLVFPLFYNRKLTKRYALLMTGVGVFSFVAFPIIVKVMQALSERFQYYYINDNAKAVSLNGVIIPWTIFAFCMFVQLRYSEDSHLNRILFNGSMLFIITSVFGLRMSIISRISYFFSPYLMAWGANSVDKISNEKVFKWVKPVVLLLFVCYIFVWFNGTPFYDFYFFWDNQFC